MKTRISTAEKLRQRCSILAEVIRAIRPAYHSAGVTLTQQQLLETMIGAAIWYLPQEPELCTGKISELALKGLVEHGTKPTRDHCYPRKLAGQELLGLPDEQLTPATIFELYRSKYGRFNLVTKEENRKLMRFQRAASFTNPDDCYKNAGVNLILLPKSVHLPTRTEKES